MIAHQRRSMGLPPSQGNTNLRLNHTANSYQSFNRLANTQLHNHNYRTTKSNAFNVPKKSQSRSSIASRVTFSSKPPHVYHIPPTAPIPTKRTARKMSELTPSNLNRRSTRHRMPPATSDSFNAFPIRPNRQMYDDLRHSSERNRLPRPSTSSQIVDQIGSIRTNDLRRHRFADNSFPIPRCRSSHSRRKPSIVSNMPLINVNSSIVMLNHSPFGLHDPRFGILHHCAQSISYF